MIKGNNMVDKTNAGAFCHLGLIEILILVHTTVKASIQLNLTIPKVCSSVWFALALANTEFGGHTSSCRQA